MYKRQSDGTPHHDRCDEEGFGRQDKMCIRDRPTPIIVAILPFVPNILCKKNATIRDVAMVDTIIGSDCFPVSTITPRLRPKPRKITAQ